MRRDVAIRAILPMTWLQRSLAVVQVRWRLFFCAGLVLGVVAVGLRVVEAVVTDSPTGGAWRALGGSVFQPWFDRDAGLFRPWVWLWREAEPGMWAWTLGEMAWNGQWDPRLSALAAIVVFAGAVGAGATMVLRQRGPVSALAIALFALAGFWLPRLPHDLVSPEAIRATGLLALGLFHIGGTWRSSGRIRGHAAGCMGALLSTAGAASALANLIVAGLGRAEGVEARRGRRGIVGWNALLLAAVVLRALLSPDGLVGAFRLSETLQAAKGGGLLTFLVVALPGLLICIGAIRRKDWADDCGRRLAVMGWWIPLMACLGGVVRSDETVLVLPWLVIALMVQGACWVRALEHAASRWGPVAAFGGVWLVAMAPLVVAMNRGLPALVDLTQAGQVRAAVVRAAVVEGNEEEFGRGLRLSTQETGEVARLVQDPRFARWLPASVRDPLKWLGADESGKGFTVAGVPALAGLPAGYSSVGTYPGEAPGPHTGDWRSGMMASTFPLLQIHVAGRVRPGQTHVRLEAADGSVGEPLQSQVTALHQWRRINVPVPAPEFFLAVGDRSPEDWLAVSSPVEIGRGTWLVGKLAGGWGIAFIGAILLWGSAAVGAGLGMAAERRPAAEVERTRGALRWLPWFLLAGYGAVLWGFWDTHAAGADSAGYLGNARLLSEGRVMADMRSVPDLAAPSRLFAPLGFDAREDGKLAPTYPSGLSLMIAAAAAVLPFEAASALVIWLHLLAGVVLVRWLARECGLEDGWAWLAAMMIGLCPLYLFMALQPMSDGPSLVWLTLAAICAMRGRDRAGWAVASGVATAVAVLLRPANAIAFLPLLVALGSWRAALLWVAGALPGAAWQLWHAWTLFGSPFATGYGNMRAAFSHEWIAPTAWHAVVQLTIAFTPVIWLACVGPFVRSTDRRVRGVLAMWVVVYFAFYAVYYYTHLTWWYLRFVLPAYPALAVLAVLGLREVAKGNGWRLFEWGAGQRAVFASVALTFAVAVNAIYQDRRLLALHSADGSGLYTELAHWMKTTLPPGSVVFAFEASAALFHHTDFTILRFDQVDAGENARVARHLRQSGVPVFAVVFDLEEQIETNARLPEGGWTRVRSFAHIDVLRLESLHESDTGGLR